MLVMFSVGVCVCRYLMEQLCLAIRDGQSSVFCHTDQTGKWRIRPDVSFLFFCSHTPCKHTHTSHTHFLCF